MSNFLLGVLVGGLAALLGGGIGVIVWSAVLAAIRRVMRAGKESGEDVCQR